MRALIGNINRYALHDGPGIRTTVFFKGCSLHCPWCHNPELISPKPEVAFYPEKCVSCGDCYAVCPDQAIHMEDTNRIDHKYCSGCGLCAEKCPAAALVSIGREYELTELLEILLRDRLYYETSGGGVTLSGGEATGQLDFAASLLSCLHREGIHTTLETNGLFFYEEFAAGCLDHLDLVLFDLKFADSVQHQKATGAENEIIKNNLSRLLKDRSQDIVVRIPVIPGYTTARDNISRIGEYLRQLKAPYYSLLPYHPYGRGKGAAVGMASNNNLSDQMLEESELAQYQKYFHGMERVVP